MSTRSTRRKRPLRPHGPARTRKLQLEPLEQRALLSVSLSGTVFEDPDGDGIQDQGEGGLSHVVVELFDAGPDGATGGDDDVSLGVNVTDDGRYDFQNVPAGDYYLALRRPVGFTISPQDQGGDDTLDSDVDPGTGFTAVFTLGAGQIDDSIDAGLIAGTTHVVTNTNDSGSGSLRQAIANANTGEIIDLSGLSGTIALTSGELTIDKSVALRGPGADTLTISGSDLDHVIQVEAGAHVAVDLSGLRIADGRSDDDGLRGFAGAGIYSYFSDVTLVDVVVADNICTGLDIEKAGGGIFNAFGNMSLVNTHVVNNTVVHPESSSGGGIHNYYGNVILENSTVANNTASFETGSGNYGGAGISSHDGTLTLRNVMVTGNTATYDGESSGGVHYAGGIIYTSGTLILSDVTVADNSVTYQNTAEGSGVGAAGIYIQSCDMAMTNATVTGNTATFIGNSDRVAGGITSIGYGDVTIANSTVTNNTLIATGSGAGGIQIDTTWVYLLNTIVADNTGGTGPDITGGLTSLGNNLIGDGTGATFKTGTHNDLVGTAGSPIDPMLGPLQDNGGPTLTHALLTGSPAIDAGTASGAPGTDQRGAMRPIDGDKSGTAEHDIGALEYQNIARNDLYVAHEDATLTISEVDGVLANDTTAGDPLPVTVVDDVLHGTLVLGADGSFTYEPDTGFSGTDRFTYKADDGVVASNLATATIIVRPEAPVAADDSYSMVQTNTLAVDVAGGLLANDFDYQEDLLVPALVEGPLHGDLDLHDDGSFTYTPDFQFGGTDSFTYVADDGDDLSNEATVTITVAPRDMTLRLAVVTAPSAADSAVTLPGSIETAPFGSTYYVEAWLHGTDTNGSGIIGGRLDLLYETDLADALSVVQG
ncbi:cadherin-like domain-containing protein, partial [bacterium]|nr:cadherin-like domain-containing protein [bacterium]